MKLYYMPGACSIGIHVLLEEIGKPYDLQKIDGATLDKFRAEQDRTTYLFDVRNPEEYLEGHVHGAISAPGGQLVQATDQYAGTLGGRIVLVDELEVRAIMTASWLRQMGWREVYVLAEKGSDKGAGVPAVLGSVAPMELTLDTAALAAAYAERPMPEYEAAPTNGMEHILIEELELGVRSYNCLKRVGIETVGDLVAKSDRDLAAIPNFGRKSIDEIRAALGAHGLRLRGDEG